MIVIGEALNATRRSVAEAVVARDAKFVARLAERQVLGGAQYLDVNAATGGNDEVRDLVWMVRVVQDAVDVPLCIDSADPKAIESAWAVHRGAPIINSVSAEAAKLASVLPLLSGQECKVVALCVGDSGIPRTPRERAALGAYVVSRLEACGVQRSNTLLDPVVLSVGTDSNVARVTLETIAEIRSTLPGVGVLVAVSNVSFGLPMRSVVNSAMAVTAVQAGADALLVDTRDRRVMSAIRATRLVLGQDAACSGYLRAYRAGMLE